LTLDVYLAALYHKGLWLGNFTQRRICCNYWVFPHNVHLFLHGRYGIRMCSSECYV